MDRRSISRSPDLLVLGETLVDLICPVPARAPAEASSFVPCAGGAGANVAINAARRGVRTGLAGTVGDDAWGAWLLATLADEAVDTRTMRAVGSTVVALALVDPDGDPSYSFHGDAFGGAEHVLDVAADALDGARCLSFSSSSLVHAPERTSAMALRERALARDVALVFDPNLRVGRWPGERAAVAAALACVPGATLVKCNEAEAAALTGASEPQAAAEALRERGARHAVVTLGARGALVCTPDGSRVVPAPAVRQVSPVGAGDAFLGALLAELVGSGFGDDAVHTAVPVAIAAGADAVQREGALAPRQP